LEGGFDILNDDEIVSSVIDNEEEEIDEDECYILNEKTTLSHTEAETMLSKCTEWLGLYVLYVCIRGGLLQPLHLDPQWTIVLNPYDR
jgi:hypothetical protein